jgi:hypothetical protein
MSEISNEIVAVSTDTLRNEVATLGTTGPNFFSSITTDDFTSKVRVFEAMQGSESISTVLNKPLEVVDIIIQVSELANEQTGVLQTVPRVILLTKDGKAYHGFSAPLYRDITNLMGILGHPRTWPAPVKLSVSQEGTGTRKYFTAKLAK